MPGRFNPDEVIVRFGGAELKLETGYQVRCGLIEVPAQMEVGIGRSGTVAELAGLFPPGTPFEVIIGNTRVLKGETDGYRTGRELGTTIQVHGRDALAYLVDTDIPDERTFENKSFFDLTLIAFDAVGIDVNDLISAVPEKLNRIPKSSTVKVETGQSWFEFLTKQYRRGGVFLFSTFDGILLSVPSAKLDPSYRITRTANETNVVEQPEFSNDLRKRYSECQVYSRFGRGKAGRGKCSGRFIDDEIVEVLNPDPANRKDGGKRRRTLVIRDKKCKSNEDADFLARRKIVESRRAGWHLSYTVAGHTTTALDGSGRIVWQPNTVVEVKDDDLGLSGNMFLESVEFEAKPEQVTHLNLMRLEDLFFAEELPSTSKFKPKKGLTVRVGVTTVYSVLASPSRKVVLEETEKFIVKEAVDPNDKTLLGPEPEAPADEAPPEE